MPPVVAILATALLVLTIVGNILYFVKHRTKPEVTRKPVERTVWPEREMPKHSALPYVTDLRHAVNPNPMSAAQRANAAMMAGDLARRLRELAEKIDSGEVLARSYYNLKHDDAQLLQVSLLLDTRNYLDIALAEAPETEPA